MKFKAKMNDRSISRFNVKQLSKSILSFTVKFALRVLLCVAILNTLITYNKWPIYSAELVVPQNEAKYPAISMCPMSNGYKEYVLQVGCLNL